MRIFFFLAGFLLITSSAFAVDMAVCVNKKGVLVAKSKCAKGETALNSKNLGGFGLFGAQGANGKDGTFDPLRCNMRESQSTGFQTVTATAACLNNEVLVSGGCDSSSFQALLREARMVKASSPYPYLNNAYGLYTCVLEDISGNSFGHTVTAQAWCCQP